MTAEAMRGDRERCLEAGMNDYVAKPIRADELVAAIMRAPQRGMPARPVGGSSRLLRAAARPTDDRRHNAAPAQRVDEC